MSLVQELESNKKRVSRWRVLKILEAGGVIGVTEPLICQCLADIALPATSSDIREVLLYLSDKKYIELKAPKYGDWWARLLPKGVDFLDDINQSDSGIARPEPI